jgi:heptosyltransferase-2
VALHFTEAARPVVLLGSRADIDVNRAVAGPKGILDLAGRTSVAEAMFVVANAALVVCNDSMTLHLASAFKTPNVAIFCATVPAFGFAPWRNRAIVIEKQGLSCRPCRRHGGRRCPTGTEACMREIDPEEVIRAAETLLRS